MINESDYKRVYNVAECAGITNTAMDNTQATRAVFEQIADWINNDEFLSSIFTAEVTDSGVSSTRYYYLMTMKTQWDCGLFYGAPSTSQTYNSVGYFWYKSGGSRNTSTKTTYSAIDLAYLRLEIIKSPYGIIADFFDCRYSVDTQMDLLLTWGKDNADADVKIAFHLANTTINIIPNSIWLLSPTLKTRSNSAKTGLLTYMVESSDIICENAKICDGAAINNQTFFEVDGQVWCSIRSNNSYVGLALRIA